MSEQKTDVLVFDRKDAKLALAALSFTLGIFNDRKVMNFLASKGGAPLHLAGIISVMMLEDDEFEAKMLQRVSVQDLVNDLGSNKTKRARIGEQLQEMSKLGQRAYTMLTGEALTDDDDDTLPWEG